MPKKKVKCGRQGETEQVNALVALGYSKAKVQKALKDSGYNLLAAQKILENLVCIASRQEAQRTEKRTPVQDVAAEVGRVESSANEGEEDENRMEEPPMRAASSKVKLHPCIVQYKKCMFGSNCLLREFPGDTCINRFHGTCIYDTGCRNRHFIEGVDVKYFNPEFAHHELPEGEFWNDEQGAYLGDSDGQGCPMGSWYPEQAESADDSCTPADAWYAAAAQTRMKQESAQIPQPFLGLFKPKDVNEKKGNVQVPVSTEAVCHVIARPQQTRQLACPPVNVKEKHPCIAQFGDCKYGDSCLHAHRDADICVHFLNGRCKFDAETCRYRHSLSSEPPARNLSETPPTATPPTLSSAPSLPATGDFTTAATPSVPDGMNEPKKHKKKDRLQLNPMQGRVPHSPRHEDPQASIGRTAASPVSRDSASVDQNGRESGSPWAFGAAASEAGKETTSVEWGSDAVASGSNDDVVNTDGTTDVEFDAFLQLAEAFPDREPSILVRTLRLHDGNVKAAADAVASAHGSNDEEHCEANDETIAKLLAEAEREDEERERAERASEDLVAAWTVSSGETDSSEARPIWAAREETLLTLCSLFPALELTSIEAVLSRCAGDYAEAYKMLLYSTENITRSNPGNYWRDASPVALHRQERLIGMFPDIHPEIVKSCFAAAKQDPKKAGEALNNLTTALLTAEEREDLGRQAVRWDPHKNKSARGPEQSAKGVYSSTPVPDVSFSEKEMRSMYQNAVNEAQEYGDWRRVRQRALIVKGCQIQTLSLAAEAFVCGDGKAAKTLSLHGKALGRECERLHRLAMLALEAERQKRDPVSTLDLHGFHIHEALEVVQRRVKLCVTQRIPSLKIIIGSGRNSAKGKSVVFPEVQSYLTYDAKLAPLIRIVALTPSIIHVRILKPRRDP